MCRLHKITYSCRHVDDILASCEFRFEGLEDANGNFYPCELSVTDLTDFSRLCLACSSLRGHDSAEQDLIDLNLANTESRTHDGPSSDGFSNMHLIVRNEAYLRKRARRAPFPPNITISFAYPSASELELQYCRNEELLTRRLRRKTFQHHLDGKLKEYWVYLEAIEAHLLAKEELENSVLTLCYSTQPQNSTSNHERSTQTFDTLKDDAASQTDLLFENFGRLKSSSWQKILPGTLYAQTEELGETFDLQNFDSGSHMDCFPDVTHEEARRAKELNQMFELQDPDIGSLIDHFPGVPCGKNGPHHPCHGQSIISDSRGKGLGGSIEDLHRLHSENNTEPVIGANNQNMKSNSSNDIDHEHGTFNPFLELEKLIILYDDSLPRSPSVDFESDLRVSSYPDTSNDKDRENTASSSNNSRNHDKGKSKAEVEDSRGRSRVPHGLIALVSPQGLAKLVEMREFLGMPYNSTPRHIYNFVNKCLELLQHCRFGTLPLHSRYEGENDADEINLLPDDIKRLEARHAFLRSWTSLHWNLEPDLTEQETKKPTRSDDGQKAAAELGDERSVWSSSSSGSDLKF